MTLTTETPASAPAVLRKLPVAAIAEHPDNPPIPRPRAITAESPTRNNGMTA